MQQSASASASASRALCAQRAGPRELTSPRVYPLFRLHRRVLFSSANHHHQRWLSLNPPIPMPYPNPDPLFPCRFLLPGSNIVHVLSACLFFIGDPCDVRFSSALLSSFVLCSLFFVFIRLVSLLVLGRKMLSVEDPG